MNQKEHAHFNPTYPDHSDSFSPNFEQRRYLHEVNSFEQSAVCNASSTSCCQPSKHHGRHGEPLYRSLLKSHHCSPHSFVEHIEGARHHNPYLFETESTAAGNCLSSQYANHSPCRCGSPMLHESNARIGLKGQSYYPNSALPNEITLYNWYLIRLDDSHSLDIAVGGFLSNRCNEVDRVETTTIVKRLEERKLLSKDGDVINLVGTIDDFRTISNGFTIQTAHTFITGFPHIWKLLVDTVLPAKAAGTVRPILGQRYMQRFSAFKGLETDLVSYSEGERSCGAKHAPKAPRAEANEKIPESAAQMEQDIFLLDVECQSKEDRRILYNQVQEKELDKNARPEDNCSEKTEHQASHGQKSTLNGEKKYANDALGEATGDAGAKADKVCSRNLDLATVQPSQKNEGELRKDKLSKALSGSSSKKRKHTSSSAEDVKGRDLSSASLRPENSARSVEKSCSWASEKEELISSVISVTKQEVVEAKKARKGKHQIRGRLSLQRSNRSSKPMSSEKHEAFEWKDPSLAPDSSKENCSGQSHDSNVPSSVTSARKRMKMVPPPLPSPVVSISTQLVSKAFGLKTSKSGRLLVPPLAHWCGQSLVRDKDGGIIAIEDGSNSIPTETGCFNFKPPIEAGAKKLQEWLSETASKCLTKKSNAPRKGNQAKGVPK